MNRFIAILFFCLSVMTSANAEVSDDDAQTDLRLNPEIGNHDEPEKIDYSAYPFLRLKNNKIDLNGADWSVLKEKFAAAKAAEGKFTVVYLGDSHIQADFGGSILRRRLAEASSDAGRGLIIPYRLAGTNQPIDYTIGLSSKYISSKLMRTPWVTEMPFTGIGVRPDSREYSIEITAPTPTRRLRFHSRGGIPSPMSIQADGHDVGFVCNVDEYKQTVIDLENHATHFNVLFAGDKTTVFGGVELIRDSIGTSVHSIGNNGATFSSYATADRFGSGLSALMPDLVIIALGTNEAFGRTSAATLDNDVDVLIASIQEYSPDATILLVGPTECYKKVYRRNKGRRRSTTIVNTKTADMARAIRHYAERENVAYYNHYAVAGSAQGMKSAKILSRDGVHFTAAGYRLWGNLLSDALLKQLEK